MPSKKLFHHSTPASAFRRCSQGEKQGHIQTLLASGSGKLSGFRWQERSNISPWPDNGHYQRDTRVFRWMLHVWVTIYLVFREKIPLSVISYTYTKAAFTKVKLWLVLYVLHPLSSASRKASLLSYVTHRRRHHRRRVIEVWLVSFKTSVGIMMKLRRLLSVKNNSSTGKLQNACLVSGALWMSFCLGSKGEASWEPGYWR